MQLPAYLSASAQVLARNLEPLLSALSTQMAGYAHRSAEMLETVDEIEVMVFGCVLKFVWCSYVMMPRQLDFPVTVAC